MLFPWEQRANRTPQIILLLSGLILAVAEGCQKAGEPPSAAVPLSGARPASVNAAAPKLTPEQQASVDRADREGLALQAANRASASGK